MLNTLKDVKSIKRTKVRKALNQNMNVKSTKNHSIQTLISPCNKNLNPQNKITFLKKEQK